MDEPNDNDTEELPAPEYWVEPQPLDGPTVTPCDDGENPRDPLLVFDYPECGLCSGIWRGPDRGERLARAVKEPGTRYALFDLLDEPQAAAKIQHILAHPAGRYDRLRRFIDELPPERRARIVKAIDRHIEPNGLDCVRWHIDPDELAAALLDEANRQAGENPAPAIPAPVADPEAQPTEAGAAGETAAAMAGTQTSARPLADEQINAMTAQQGITLRDACRVISAAREDSDAGTPEGKKRLRGRIRGRITPIGKEGQTDIFDAWCLFQLLHSLGECPPPNAMMAAAKKKGFIIRRPRPPQN